MEPLITTIIPTYRRPKLLRRAIKSVLGQTFPHFQVCVYDNASGDETSDVVAELAQKDSRIKYYCHPENIGAFNNFNYGMEHVNTPYFSFLSDDDILLPDFYQDALDGFTKHPEAIFSACASIHVDEHGRILGIPISSMKEGLYPPPTGMIAMLKYSHPEWTAILFRREVIEKVGTINDNNAGLATDVYYELLVSAQHPIYISPVPGAIFTRCNYSASTQVTFDDSLRTWFNIYLKLLSFIEERHILSLKNKKYFKSS